MCLLPVLAVCSLSVCSSSLLPSAIRHMETRVNPQGPASSSSHLLRTPWPLLCLPFTNPMPQTCFAEKPSQVHGHSTVTIVDTFDTPQGEWLVSWGWFLPRTAHLHLSYFFWCLVLCPSQSPTLVSSETLLLCATCSGSLGQNHACHEPTWI